MTKAGAVRAESVTVNIAGAKIWGIELETMLRPARGLSLTANFGYLNARFTDFCADTDSALSATNAAVPLQCGPAVGVSLAGSSVVQYIIPVDNTANDMANAPKYSWSLAADYKVPVGFAELGFHVDARHTSRYNTWGRSNDPFYYRAAATMVNASISLKGQDDHWSLTGYVKNLTDETVMSGAVNPGGGNPIQQYYQPPREFGVEVGFKF